MGHAQTIDFNVISLLENPDFLRYVLDADEQQKATWMVFEQEHPQWKPAIKQAAYILQHLDDMPDVLPEEELEQLKLRIKATLSA